MCCARFACSMALGEHDMTSSSCVIRSVVSVGRSVTILPFTRRVQMLPDCYGCVCDWCSGNHPQFYDGWQIYRIMAVVCLFCLTRIFGF